MPQLIPTAQRVMQVFEVFARERRPLTNSEMARYLNLADSSCSDLLHTLRHAGYLLRTPRSRFFHPTGRLIDIAQVIAGADHFRAFAAEALEMLTRQSGETSMCGHIDGDKVKIFACQESARALRYVLRPGATPNLHSTALGKALLGSMDPNERDATIDALPMESNTPLTITDRALLRADVELGVQRKWFLAKDEGGEGVCAIGIAGRVDDRLAAFSIVGPTHRFEKNLESYTDIMIAARAEIFES